MTRSAAAVLIVGVSFAACATPPATPTDTQPAPATAPVYRPVITLNQIMVSVVDSNSHEIWDVEENAKPTDAQWAELEHSAVTLAAAGNLTTMSGNGPKDQQWTQQPDWAKHSTAVSDAGLAAMQAVRERNVAGVRKAGDALVLACINCHKEYRLEIPKIWSDHEAVPN